MPELLVGCPVRDRAWVLPAWFRHVRVACGGLGLVPEFVFVGAPLADPITFRVIQAQAGPLLHVVESGEVFTPDLRRWNHQRYEHMAKIRNRLLGRVRELAPRYFLSVDSDVLLHRLAVDHLYETAERFDAVGSRIYMTPKGVRAPSYGMFRRDGGIQRTDSDGVFKVDCIMAVKLMGPAAYAVDYRMDMDGEDVGWSKNCKAAGVKLGWDGRVCSKHCLDSTMLHVIDPRCGF